MQYQSLPPEAPFWWDSVRPEPVYSLFFIKHDAEVQNLLTLKKPKIMCRGGRKTGTTSLSWSAAGINGTCTYWYLVCAVISGSKVHVRE